MPDRSENMKHKLLEYRGQGVGRCDGVSLECRVGLIPNLEYDREELDLYSEVIRENITPLRGPNKASSREFGSRQRFCMIVVDSELPLDEPVDLGVAELCDACLLRARKCPAGRDTPRTAVVAVRSQEKGKRPQVLDILHHDAHLRRLPESVPNAPLRLPGGDGALRTNRRDPGI